MVRHEPPLPLVCRRQTIIKIQEIPKGPLRGKIQTNPKYQIPKKLLKLVKLKKLATMSLDYIFSTNYLFDSTPPTESRLYLPLSVLFGTLILLSILVKINKKLDKKIRDKQFYCYLITGILGWTYLFGRYEALPWLGSRLYLALIGSTLLAWIVYMVIWMIIYTPRQREIKSREEIFRRYLPKENNIQRLDSQKKHR